MNCLNYIALLISGVLFPYFSAAQYNYVPNPSFEEHTSCPTGYSQMDKCIKWRQATQGTADYLLDCGTSSTVGTPSNSIGYQVPRTGAAYAGMICYSTSSIADYKEYLEVKLKAPLVAGYNYKITFYVSLAEGVSTYAIKNIGFVLSPLDVGFDYDYQTIPNVPLSAIQDDYISTTNDWVKLEFDYTALGGEEHLTLGNFDKSDDTDAQIISSSGDGFAYYFVDDVSVEIDLNSEIFGDNYGNGYDSSATSTNAYYLEGSLMDVIIPNIITVNSDGINEDFFIKYWGYIDAQLLLVDRWGKLVYESENFLVDSWSPQTEADGVFFYTMKLMRPDGHWDEFQGILQVV